MPKAKTGRKRHRKKRSPLPATVTPYSENQKTGRVTVTYVAQGSCPLTCPFLDGGGCYAEEGPIGILTRRLNKAGAGMTPDELAEAEAAQIEAAPATTDMRLHGVGDCRTDAAARRVEAASSDYMLRGRAFGVKVWTYTHAFGNVARESWGAVSVLASVETPEAGDMAMRAGYAVAIVVPEFETDGESYRQEWPDGPVTVIPCVYQTRGVQCVKCRLCMDDASLLAGRRVIAFAAHGARRKTVVKSLEVLNGRV